MASLIRHPVSALGSGVSYSVTEMCFGTGPEVVTIQAGLHADECPPILVASQLVEKLTELEAAQRLRACIRVITQANPIGGSQWLRGHHVGRIDLSSGRNFNRQLPQLADQILTELTRRLTDDAAKNRQSARELWLEALSGYPVESPVDALHVVLLSRAIEASWVLDLHSDDEAEPHVYGFPSATAETVDMAARLGAPTVLMAQSSGAESFDDTLMDFWATLHAEFPDAGFAQPLIAMTIELRGTRDVSRALAEQDAEAILDALRAHDLIAGVASEVSQTVSVKPLAGMDPVTAPDSGLLVWHAHLGDVFEAGTLLAELYRPDRPNSPALAIRARVAGRLIAKRGHPWVRSGDVVAKVASDQPLAWRVGALLGGRS